MSSELENKKTPALPRLDPELWLEDHGDILFRFCLARIRNPVIAEDLVQETFLAAMKAKERFSGRSSERTWLVGILKHKIIDHIRKSKRETLSEDIDIREAPTEEYFDRKGHWKVGAPEWVTNPTRAYEQKEFWGVLDSCMKKLQSKQHEVFQRRELEGQDASEICEALDISSSNLWVLLYRARLQLRKCLEKNWFEREPEPEG
jgi:RNA polymerase sigma-70 factor (ECF subfamily)